MNLPGYEILDTVASVGLTVVHRARQRSLGRVVAVRTTREGPHSETVDRCLRWEAAVLARVQHPHVISIVDLLEDGDRVYLVQEDIEGGTLAARIAGRPQPVRPAASLVERLARTLAFVHQRGITHCNLKPGVVLLANPPAAPGRDEAMSCEEVYGIPLLGDFELAVDRQQLADFMEGRIFGTPAYLAPEQALVRPQDIGPATDIHGLGAILYEMLTGRPPFQGTSLLDILPQVIEKEPEPVRSLNPGVDRNLEAICHKCLRKDPARRYAGGQELASELRNFLDGLSRRRWFG